MRSMPSMPTFIATIPFRLHQTSLHRCELFLMTQNSNPSWSWTDESTHPWLIDCRLVSSWISATRGERPGTNHHRHGTRRARSLGKRGSARILRNYGVRPNVLRSHDGETNRRPGGPEAVHCAFHRQDQNRASRNDRPEGPAKRGHRRADFQSHRLRSAGGRWAEDNRAVEFDRGLSAHQRLMEDHPFALVL